MRSRRSAARLLVAVSFAIALVPGPIDAAERAPEAATTRASIPRAVPSAGAAADPVAIVSELTGAVETCLPGSGPCPAEARVALSRFAWLVSGDRLELPERSRLTLIHLDGMRFELSGPLGATVWDREVEATAVPRRSALAGPAVRALPRVDAPAVLSIARDEGAATVLGAIRLRAGGLDGLYPHEAAATLADGTTLSFTPVAAAARYDVSLLDPVGRKVFGVRTSAAEVTVPRGILVPGAPYLWRVATVDHPGGVLRAEAEFRTLGSASAAARARLQRALPTGDPAALLAMAEVDRRLGLLAEARQDLVAVAALAPDDPAVAQAASWVRGAIDRVEQAGR